MPILDMPISQLLQYTGRNECPADIDEYWDEAVAEVEALGTEYTLEKAEFQAPGTACYHLWFTGVGGARIHAKLVHPTNPQGKLPAVLEFHGYTGDCGSFKSKLAYAGAGFVCAAMDCRGQGGRSEDTIPVKGNTHRGHIIRGLEDDPKKLYYRAVFQDCAQLARIVMSLPYVDESRVGAMGGSQGGGLTLACAALTPTLNRAAATYPFLSDYRRVWEMDLAKNAYAELTEYFRHTDPTHCHEKETFSKLGYIDNHNMAHRIRCKVLMLTGLMDNICPPSTQFAAYNNIPGEKGYILYPDFGHEYLTDSDDAIMQFMLGM